MRETDAELIARKKALTHKITKRENRQLKWLRGRVLNNTRLRSRIYDVDEELEARGYL